MLEELNDVFLPLLRMDVVLMPHNSIVLEAGEEPFYSFVKDMIQDEGEFAVFYEDEEGMSEYGSIAFIDKYEYDDDKIVCKITGKERMEAKSIIPSEKLGNSLKSIAASGLSAEELRSISLYDFVDGVKLADDEETPDMELRSELFGYIEEALLKLNPDYDIVSLKSWIASEQSDELSFRLMNGFVTENSPALNIVRIELLKSKSENERLRILKTVLSSESKQP